MWETHGGYRTRVNAEQFRIFPEGKDGVVKPITLIRQFLTLKCEQTGSCTIFKHYLHQKQWYWQDSRTGKMVPEDHVRSEVGRMTGCDPQPLLQRTKDAIPV